MTVLVLYATSEGQTRKIARRVADRIAAKGRTVEILPISEAEDVDLSSYDGVILAASIHVGHYQRALSDFVAKYAEQLRTRPTLFLSVSLAAAGHEAEDWRGLASIQADLEAATGWKPDRVEQIAGAYMPSKYDILRRFVMRRIIAAKDPKVDLGKDHEYTDWPALGQTVDAWLGTAKA